MEENRVKLAMEANDVSEDEFKDAMEAAYKNYYSRYMIWDMANSLLSKGIDYYSVNDCIITVKAVAEVCNCSADYLLGLSDVMNPVGN